MVEDEVVAEEEVMVMEVVGDMGMSNCGRWTNSSDDE